MTASKRKLLYSIFALGLLIVGVLSIVLFVRDTGPQEAKNNNATPSRLTQQEAQSLAADLTSGDIQRISKAIALPSGQPVTSEVAMQFKSYRSVRIDASTFSNSADQTASVDGQVIDEQGNSKHWKFYLIHEDSSWKISETIPQE